MKALVLLDDDRVPVNAGDTVRFNYGIPPVVVDAKIVQRRGQLIALTPGHDPAESANLAAEAANLAFNRWRDTLTPEEVENLVNGIPGPREQALKHAWRKQQEMRQS